MSEAAETRGNAVIDRDLVFEIEQFYYAEARLLHDRLFKQWLTLLAPDVSYTLPSRHTALPDPKLRGEEGMYDPERELSRGLEAPYRDENLLTLSIRADRAYKVNSRSDNPAARTRRFVSNVFAEPAEAPSLSASESRLPRTGCSRWSAPPAGRRSGPTSSCRFPTLPRGPTPRRAGGRNPLRRRRARRRDCRSNPVPAGSTS